VSTDGEFHTLRRQLTRLGEAGLDVVRLPAQPADTLAERLAEAVDERTSAVLVSAVLFETGHVVPGIDADTQVLEPGTRLGAYRRRVLHWIVSAKGAEVRQRRLVRVIDLCASGRRA
jgi:hypothetical protein